MFEKRIGQRNQNKTTPSASIAAVAYVFAEKCFEVERHGKVLGAKLIFYKLIIICSLAVKLRKRKKVTQMPNLPELIGDHPIAPNIFGKWFQSNDTSVTPRKKHRSLTPTLTHTESEIVEWLGRKLFDHHHSDYRKEKLIENFNKLGYEKYAEQHRRLPIADKTKKGNATEIILTEYIESCYGKKLIKVFKLKYNPNVDQALKGDDTLMVDIINDNGKNKVKIYLGEAKFRKSPTKKVVKTIANSLSKDKKPLSYTFLIDELGRDPNTKNLADILDSFIIDEIKGKGDLIYTGMLLSNSKTSTVVEASLDSDNQNKILISIGIDNPENLIIQAFKQAEYLVANPDKL